MVTIISRLIYPRDRPIRMLKSIEVSLFKVARILSYCSWGLNGIRCLIPPAVMSVSSYFNLVRLFTMHGEGSWIYIPCKLSFRNVSFREPRSSELRYLESSKQKLQVDYQPQMHNCSRFTYMSLTMTLDT